MIALDTNLVLRLLLDDEPVQSRQAQSIMDCAVDNRNQKVKLDRPIWRQRPASSAACSIQSPIFSYPLSFFHR